MKIKTYLSIQFFFFLVICLITGSCVNDNLEGLTAKKTVDSTASSSTTPTATTPTTTITITTPATTPVTTITSTVSFLKDIKPILNKYQCASCHGSSYSSYTGVSSLARSGQLYGTMSWSSGYRKMPPNQKPSSAELALITTWIKEGTLNN